MVELKNCPFCGSKAEIHMGTSDRGRILCSTQSEAQAKLEEYAKNGTVVHYAIHPHNFSRVGMKAEKQKWRLAVLLQTFAPRCANPRCIGRTTRAYLTESEAANVWNRRISDG